MSQESRETEKAVTVIGGVLYLHEPLTRRRWNSVDTGKLGIDEVEVGGEKLVEGCVVVQELVEELPELSLHRRSQAVVPRREECGVHDVIRKASGAEPLRG